MSAHLKLKKLSVLLLITGILLSVVQTKFVKAQSNIPQNVPQVIHSCETDNESKKTYCFIWRWNGSYSYFEIFNQEGRRISGDIMEVERFDEDLVVMYLLPSHLPWQIDPVRRRDASYKGHPNGDRIKNGVVKTRSFISGKKLRTYTWNARW